MAISRTCPKCGGAMVEGFIVDQGYGVVHPGKWHPGAPVKSFWTGIKQRKKEQIDIAAYRCDRCGFLENYAVQQ